MNAIPILIRPFRPSTTTNFPRIYRAIESGEVKVKLLEKFIYVKYKNHIARLDEINDIWPLVPSRDIQFQFEGELNVICDV